MRKAIAALALGAMCAGLTGGAAVAQVMSGDAAKKQLFNARNMILLPQDLSVFQGAMRETVNLTLDQMRGNSQMSKFVEGGYGYYGAVAFPVAGSEAVPPVIVAQLNTPQAAASAAVTTCQQQNGGHGGDAGGRDCLVQAERLRDRHSGSVTQGKATKRRNTLDE